MGKTYSTTEAAELLRLKPQTLRLWRLSGGGPRYVRLSANRVVYTEEALLEFTRARTFGSTAEEAGRQGKVA